MCSKCGKFYELYELDDDNGLKIVIVGKWNGPNHFVTQLGMELEKQGHEVIHINRNEMLKWVQPYEMKDCKEYKKPIPLRGLEYTHSPDLIFVEQTYLCYKNDCVKTPVFYHHREYTHFADMLDPDALLFAYPCREEVYDFYHPYAYYQIPIKDDLWNAVNMDYFKPKEKVFNGLLDIGWQIEYWQFSSVNGPFAREVIREQERYSNWAEKVGLTERYKAPINMEQYRELLMGGEAILIDGGLYGWLTRRVFEAAASKTLMAIRIYNNEQYDFYKNIGLDGGRHYIPISDPYNTTEIDISDKSIVENAYKWVKNHTYKKRAKELIEIYGRLFF